MLFEALLVQGILLWMRTRASGADLRFLIVGDWGGRTYYPYHTQIERGVANQMGRIAEVIRPDFVISVGDNFYSHGVTSVDDVRFKETFEKVFRHPLLNVPWFVVAGNHDHRGNVLAQIRYTERSARWYFPDYNYVKKLKLADGREEVTLVFIDTVLLCGITDKYFQGQGPVGPENAELAEEIWGWFESKLASSRSEYLLVVGHYPVLSVGYHGSTLCLFKRLRPLLFKYRVTAYLSGHDHNLQHFTDVRDGTCSVEHVVSGAGALINSNRQNVANVPEGSLQFVWPGMKQMPGKAKTQSGGFAYAKLNARSMDITFVDGTGRELHHVTTQPRHPVLPTPDVRDLFQTKIRA